MKRFLFPSSSTEWNNKAPYLIKVPRTTCGTFSPVPEDEGEQGGGWPQRLSEVQPFPLSEKHTQL